MQKVKIYFVFSSEPGHNASPVSLAIQHVIKTLVPESLEIVDSAEKADLIISDNAKMVAQDWDKNKRYVFVSLKEVPNLPQNASWISPLEVVKHLLCLIPQMAETLPTKKDIESPTRDTPRKPAATSAKKVLVVDDSPANIISALETIPTEEYSVETASSYEEAIEILSQKYFDFVLTDLHLPMSPLMLSDKAFRLGELVPYGLMILLASIRQGVKKIAVVTDLSHHDDAFSASFDHFVGEPIIAGEVRIELLRAHLRPDKSKDWSIALKKLLS